MFSKYSYYLHWLLAYTVLLPLKFSILMFKLFYWILHLNIDSTPLGPPYPTPLAHPLAPPFFPLPLCPCSTTPSANNLAPPPKVNWWLKIVNYFTCMQHFFCRWYRPPEVDLNWYPRISNPYCWDIQIRKCEWSQGYKMTQVNCLLNILNYFTYMWHFFYRW